MPTRKPLVIISGLFSELPAGDTTVALAAAPSGLIYVGSSLGIDGSAQISGNAGISQGVIALASGNAALDKGIFTAEWVIGANGNNDYTFTGPGFSGGENDPLITLVRGQQYKFTNTMGAHPFRVQITPNGSVGTQYNAGITNNDVINGTLIWNVQFDAPNTLYYQCTSHSSMGGSFYIVDNGAINALASGNAGISAAQTAQASGNAGISAAQTAQASGNAALVVGANALSSGNAALSSLDNKYDKTGGVLSGTVIVNKQSFGTVNTITSSSVLLVDFSTGNNFTVTLASNATFAGPINASGGQCGAITIRQDNTGSRTLAYSGSWAFQGGTAPTLTTAASGIDVLAYYVVAPTRVVGILTAAYSGGSQ
jgi:hypothetical protein